MKKVKAAKNSKKKPKKGPKNPQKILKPEPQLSEPDPPEQVKKSPELVVAGWMVVLLLIIGVVIWVVVSGEKEAPEPASSNGAPTTLKVINSNPSDIPTSKPIPPKTSPNQSSSSSLQNAPMSDQLR